ncbi:hypothetical protein [Agrobacterium vitis]|uniref:hypothetical protein n=1 Tax=Agrobacterium vitis TaxID=373 RepID=UPI000871BD5B|nr:hypothetical protein [Agrobacterium vitis]MUO72922.1 hypothetical protein [Agrobacterium vitis]
MGIKAQTCAIDLGTVFIKAVATLPGVPREVVFPARLSMGSRVVSGRERPPQVILFDDALVRVGDRSTRVGFVESEMPSALWDAHGHAVMIAAAFDRLGVNGASTLMLGSDLIRDQSDAAYLLNLLSRCRTDDGRTFKVDRLGTMGTTEAILADFSLTPSGAIGLRTGKEERGRFGVLDLGSSSWRLSLVADGETSGKVQFRTVHIPVKMALERRACELIEERHRVPVSGMAEMFTSRVVNAKRKKLDVTMLIATAWRETWAIFGPRIVDEIAQFGATTMYAAGGNATLLKEVLPSVKDIDFKIAKQCEISIVRGLLKSARRWGGQA